MRMPRLRRRSKERERVIVMTINPPFLERLGKLDLSMSDVEWDWILWVLPEDKRG